MVSALLNVFVGLLLAIVVLATDPVLVSTTSDR